MCLDDQKLVHKMYGTWQDKRVGLKKEIKDRTRLLQEVRAFHKRYFTLRDCMESEQMVFEITAITVSENIVVNITLR